MTASVAIAYCAGLLESLKQQQLLDTALLNNNIPPQSLSNPDSRINFQRYIKLWQSAVELSQDPLLGLRIGSDFHPGNLGGLASILLAAPTLMAAAEQLIRYEHVLQDGVQTRMGTAGEQVYFDFSCGLYDAELVRPLIEKEVAEALALAKFVLQRVELQGDTVHEVWFKHAAAGPVDEYEKILGTKVKFSQPYNRLIASPEALSLNTSFGNEGVFNSVVKELGLQAGKDLETQVRRRIAESIHQGVPEIKQIAEEFGMSHRTFQRRLASDGCSYKDLVTSVRRETATQLLKRADCSIGEVAYLVGFTETSTFHQAFKRWTGQSPGEYRKNH